MPAPESTSYPKDRPILGHVNLMADTLIANANLDDLRAIVRNMLATSPPTVAASFTAAARSRLRQSRGKSRSRGANLFAMQEDNPTIVVPTPELNTLLAYARSLYGAGMGFDSIEVLASVVRATSGLHWNEDSEMADALAVIDADISQAIQSCREEIGAGNVRDIAIARAALRGIQAELDVCHAEVEGWGGEFPFERGAANAESLHI